MAKTRNVGIRRDNAYFNCYLVSRHVSNRIRLEYKIGRQEIDILIILKKLESKGFTDCSNADIMVFCCGSLAYNISKTINKLIRGGFIVNKGKRIRNALSLTEEAESVLERFYFLCQDKIKDMYDKFEVKRGIKLNKRQRLKAKRSLPPSGQLPDKSEE